MENGKLYHIYKDSPKLAPTSDEFKRLEYTLLLNMCVGLTFSDMSIYQINPNKLSKKEQ